MDKTAKVLPSKDPWQVYYILFARSPLTKTALQRAQETQTLVVDLNQIEQDMIRWLESS